MVRRTGYHGNGQTCSCCALRSGNGCRYSRCRFLVFQASVLGTADGEFWHCPALRGFLFEIPEAPVIAAGVNSAGETQSAGPKTLRRADQRGGSAEWEANMRGQ